MVLAAGCSPESMPAPQPDHATTSPRAPTAANETDAPKATRGEPPFRVVDRPTDGEGASEFAGIWPHVRPADLEVTPERWSDPAEVARGFLRVYVGVPNPRAGPFRAGEPGSGEVEVRRGERGPLTTVIVRQLGRQGPGAPWTVTAAAANSLRVGSPGPFDHVSSPLKVAGESTAFEAIADVDVRENGQTWGKSLGHSILTGGANGEFAPFDGDVRFVAPSRAAGAVVFYTLSVEDGLPMEATVVKVRF
jgi:hypothetical protein